MNGSKQKTTAHFSHWAFGTRFMNTASGVPRGEAQDARAFPPPLCILPPAMCIPPLPSLKGLLC
jgi:hypothetical protein